MKTEEKESKPQDSQPSVVKTPMTPRGRKNLASLVYHNSIKIAARQLDKEG